MFFHERTLEEEATLCASYPLGRFMLTISLIHRNARGCTLLSPLLGRGGK